jgi:2,3-bisphosphoglycerate-dependent phosphoglycerate mutase
MELYLIRHAESENNARPVEDRTEDPSLTATGEQQARALAEAAAPLALTHLRTSPFLRALQTARPIFEATGIVPEVRIDLHEYGGCFLGHDADTFAMRPGMGRDAIRSAFPRFLVPDEIPDEGWWAGRSFETPIETQARAARVARDLIERHADSDERIGFVTHGTFTQFLVGELVGMSFLRKRWLGGIWNAAITKFVITSEETTLHYYNSVRHVPEPIVTRTGNLIEGF